MFHDIHAPLSVAPCLSSLDKVAFLNLELTHAIIPQTLPVRQALGWAVQLLLRTKTISA